MITNTDKANLEELTNKYTILTELTMAMEADRGRWFKKGKLGIYDSGDEDSEPKKDVVFWDDVDEVGVRIDEDDFVAFNYSDYECVIDDPALIGIVERQMKPSKKKV